ncbi:MAG: hypothetical protein JST52_09295 [Bacteroidetes bacterium]|nr:hypothetical protein [Bacteroidota bacterium]MBS1740635.1 hypothetical protein [Bacteroidota bacterium]
MKQRLLTGWNFRRVVYLVVGSALLIDSIWRQQWLGVVFGGYFAAMGIFAFGCASGNCFNKSCCTDYSNKNETNLGDPKK